MKRYFDRTKVVKLNEELYVKIREIRKRFPDIFKSDSQVLRAGLNLIYSEWVEIPDRMKKEIQEVMRKWKVKKKR